MPKPKRSKGSTPNLQSALQVAIAYHQQGKLAQAEQQYQEVLQKQPDQFDALHLLGVIKCQQGKNEEGVELITAALAKEPKRVEALSNLAIGLASLKRHADTIACLDKLLAIEPNHADALYRRGMMLGILGRNAEANECFDKVLAITPSNIAALFNRGVVLGKLDCHEEALAAFDKVLAIKPDHAVALHSRGVALGNLNRHEEAIASYDNALAIKPDYLDALINRGNTLAKLYRHQEALTSYDKALAAKPNDAEAWYRRGAALSSIGRHGEAILSFEKALALNPNHPYALGGLAISELKICNWQATARLGRELEIKVSEGKSAISPFAFLAFCSDPSKQLQCAINRRPDKVPVLPKPLWTGAIYPHDRIRLAYLSADFHGHATAYLMAELFELHDRSRFEIIAVSFGPDDRSEMRLRLVKAFDQFHDVISRSDRDVAKLLNDLQVDIAIDLKGYTNDSRLGILAHRPAPIQVSYLGYPGTTGADFIDYVIADKIVLPFEQQPFYTEKIVHLPDCYQANDSKRRISPRIRTRSEVGLPEKGFVFCCFNNSYKITADVFDVWMRLLTAVSGSALWLLGTNDLAMANLRREAEARGIDPARIVFAERLGLEDHLARHRLADLFLDTLPVCAHTTASDALWAGLPILTCAGTTFVGRVAASLLQAIGLPELVTKNLDEYQAVALKVATDSSLMQSLRHKLEDNRLSTPLFNVDRFRRHIEAAYTTMWEIWQRGETARSFAVSPVSTSISATQNLQA